MEEDGDSIDIFIGKIEKYSPKIEKVSSKDYNIYQKSLIRRNKLFMSSKIVKKLILINLSNRPINYLILL